MNVLARNVIANALGGGVGILLNLIAVPIQIRILGPEAFGLIGFIYSVQIVLVIFDLGLPSTLIREIALDKDAERTFSKALVQTCSTIYWVIVLVAALLFVLAADWIADEWLHVESLSPAYVAGVLRMVGVYIILTWPLGIYSSTLAGLQRFEILNTLKVISVFSGQLGSIAILLLTRDLHAMIIWWVVNAFAVLVAHIWMCYRLLPGLSLKPLISRWVIRRVWKFAFDLNLISTLAAIYTQTDRILISAFLPLKMLGYYSVAYNVALQIGIIQEFINKAMMPALSAKVGTKDVEALGDFYVRYAQLLMYVVTLPAFIFIFFSYEILAVWAGREIAVGGAPAMSVLAIGFLLNAPMSSSYILSIASGHTRIAVWVNAIAFLIYVPIMLYLVTTYGITGAALGWVMLNLYYLIIFVPFTQRRILQSNVVAWSRRIMLPFSVAGIFVFGTGWWIQQRFSFDWAWLVNCIGCALVYTVVGLFFLAPSVRHQITSMPRQILSKTSHPL